MIKIKKLIESTNFGMAFMLEKKNKSVLDGDEIVIPQVGRMLYSQLKKNIEGKASDLAKIIKQGDYSKVSDRQLELLSHFVRVARAYQEGSKVPLETKFK